MLTTALLSFLLTLALGAFALFRPAPLLAQETPAPEARPIAVIDTTLGVMEAELYTDLAPLTAGNFIKLAESKFYDGTIFHRVIDQFMIQGGDPKGTGTGGPGYQIKDEFGPGLSHEGPGVLSMANSGPDTGGSQFFITLVPTPWLNGKHAIFGKVVRGLDVLRAIGKTPTDSGDRPLEEVKINSIAIKRAEADTPPPSAE
ncbi:MAG: peptidylprolyl isomerase [Deltaproteobacteria bacterium]|jgi:cyclophilin family peptidyl-prolyl cis-trans isomerase|nr:peptidylprolyl isomerase [Deltaproteobacteria bacterium]